MPTKEQLNKILVEAKNQIYASADKIQAILNIALDKAGVLSKEEYNALDEEMRRVKEKLMKDEAKKSMRNLVIGAAVVIGAVWALTIIIRKKHND